MPTFLSLCLALLRLAIRATDRVQGLLVDLHNTVEWVIEQRNPSLIRSTNEESTSRSLSLPPSVDTVDKITSDPVTPSRSLSLPSAETIDVVASDHVTPSKSLIISVAEAAPSVSTVEVFRSQILPSTHAVTNVSSDKVSKSAGMHSTFYQPENADKFGDPPVPEDEAKVKRIEVTLKLYNKEPTTEPVVSVSSRREVSTLGSEDQSSAVTSSIIRQTNEQCEVRQSVTSAEDSIIKNNESKWSEYRMMLKWYRNETIVPIPNKDGLDYDESTEVEPLDLSTNSENIEDVIDHEEVDESHPNRSPLETTKNEDNGTPIVTQPTRCKLSPTKVDSAPVSSLLTTTSTSTTDLEIQGNINQDYTEAEKSKDYLMHEREESEKESSLHSSESACLSMIHKPSEELETSVALEVKALPDSLMHEPWLFTHKATYDIDLKFEKNLHLKEYDLSTIREKGSSRFQKSPIRDSLTGKKHDIEPTRKPSDRKKLSRTPIKSMEGIANPSLAVASSQSLSLPQFCVDSSTGNVQWKSVMPCRDVTPESRQRSPYKQSKKSTISNKKASPIKGTTYETSHSFKMESEKTLKASEPNLGILTTETSTSEEEVQFKPTRERQPTPPPPRFPYVDSSTDSEKVDSEAKSLSFNREPIKLSTVDSEFRTTRERRQTPAADSSTIDFSQKSEVREIYKPLSIVIPNEASVVKNVGFMSTRERRLTPAAKFVDHESTTSSDNEKDQKSNLALSIPSETLNFKEKSPLKSKDKHISSTEVGFILKLSPRKQNAANDQIEQYLALRNQAVGADEREEFAFKPTRERRPTPAARFPTPETTDSENSTQSQHPPQSRSAESYGNKPEPNPTCERISSCVPGMAISGSPTSREDVSVVSKLGPRLMKKSSTSPRSAGKSRTEAKTSPSIRFQIPESQTKKENTGAIRKEFRHRKSTKEMSTSEEEYEPKQAYKRKASPAKYPFLKSPRMLADASAVSRTLDFSSQKVSSENKNGTLPLGEGNTFTDRDQVFKDTDTNENTYTESVSDRSLLKELLIRTDVGDSEPSNSRFPGSQIFKKRSNKDTNDDDSYTTTCEGESVPIAKVLPDPHHPTRAPHNSPNHFKETSPEMSTSESTSGTTTSDGKEEDSALDAETDVGPQAEGNRSLSDRETERFLRQHGFRFHYVGSTSSDSTTESSIGYGSGEGDSAPEGTDGLSLQSETIAENIDASGTDCPHPGSENSKPLANVDRIDDMVETDSDSSNSSAKTVSTLFAEDSSPEGTEGIFPQLSDNESLIIAEKVHCNSSESYSELESSTQSGKPSDICRLDSTSENKSVTNEENVDINAVLDSLISSPTAMESSHEFEDSEPEGTSTLSPLKTTDSPVNSAIIKDDIRDDTRSLLTKSVTETSTVDSFVEGNPYSEENCPQKPLNVFSCTNLAENTRLETDSTLESLKCESAPQRVDTQPSAIELPTQIEISRNTSSEMNSILSEAKQSETSNSDKILGDVSTREESDLGEFQEISNFLTSAEKSKDEFGTETDSSSMESTSRDKFIGRSSEDSEYTKTSDHSQPETKELPKGSEESDDSSSETDSKSSESTLSEKSSSDAGGDYFAIGDSRDLRVEQKTCKSLTDTGKKSQDEWRSKDTSISGFTHSDTSISIRLEGNYENPADNCLQIETGELTTDSEISNIVGNIFTSSASAQSKILEGSKRVSLSEESTGKETPIETCESFSANFPDVRTEFEQAYLVIEKLASGDTQFKTSASVGENYPDVSISDQACLVGWESTSENALMEIFESDNTNNTDRSEFSQTCSKVEEIIDANSQLEFSETVGANLQGAQSESDQAHLVEVPSTDAASNPLERLSPIIEVSTNGTISDVNYSDYENGYSISSPSESSSEHEGEFILEQEVPYSPPISISPKNGDSTSEAEVLLHHEPSGRSEYLHSEEPLAVSSPWPRLPICESPTNEKKTSKSSDSDTTSSLSPPSKSPNSEEECNKVDIEMEVTSNPNFDKSETCDVLSLPLYPESSNMGKDKNGKDSIYLQVVNEFLEVTDCTENVETLLVETVQRLEDYNTPVLESASQTQSQILDTDFNPHSIAYSSNIEVKTLCDISVDSNSKDETEVIHTTQSQTFISEASKSMEMENSLVSEDTESSDTLAFEKEIYTYMFASVDSTVQPSLTKIDSDNIIDVCSIRKSDVSDDKVIENASSGCEEVFDSTITKELTDSHLHPSDISVIDCETDAEVRELDILIETTKTLILQGIIDETYIEKDRKQISESTSLGCKNNQTEMISSVLFQSRMGNTKVNEPTVSNTNSFDASESSVCFNDDGLVKCSNEVASESNIEYQTSSPDDVSSSADKSQTYDCGIETRSTGCEDRTVADNTELEIPVVSEFLICKEVPIESLSKSDDFPELSVTSLLIRNVNASPSVGRVETKNSSIITESSNEDELINMDSDKYDNGDVSTRSAVYDETSIEAKDDPNAFLSTETRMDKPPTNFGCIETDDVSAIEEKIAFETSTKNIFRRMQSGTVNKPAVVSNITEGVVESETSTCHSSESLETVHAEKIGGLNIETPPSSEATVCSIPTCEDAELDSKSEISFESDIVSLQDVPKAKFELKLEHSTQKSTVSDLMESATCTETLGDYSEMYELEHSAQKPTVFDLMESATCTETLGDDSEMFEQEHSAQKPTVSYLMESPTCTERLGGDSENSESACEESTDGNGIKADFHDSRNAFEPKSPVCDESTNAVSDETRNKDDTEVKTNSESFAKEETLRENLSEFEDSNIPQLSISGIKSANDTGIGIVGNSHTNTVTECTGCDSSNDHAELIKSPDGNEFEVYIASEPITCDVALGSAIVVLSSETPIDADHIDKVSESIPLVTEFDSFGKSLTKNPEGENGQGVFASESITCDTLTNADVMDEIPISIPSIAIMAMDDQTSVGDSTADLNLDISVPNVPESLMCEVSKNAESDNADQESTTPSLEAEGCLDSSASAEKKAEEVEEDLGTNIENKPWKKKSRKPKKKRKH